MPERVFQGRFVYLKMCVYLFRRYYKNFIKCCLNCLKGVFPLRIIKQECNTYFSVIVKNKEIGMKYAETVLKSFIYPRL